MTAKYLTVQRLPMLLAMGFLSTGLLLSGCSDNKNDDASSPDAAEATESADAEAVDQTVEADAENTVDDIPEDAGVQIPDSVEDKSTTTITNDDINPLTDAAKQPSLVTNPTEVGTPEDTVKQALDTLYYGDANKAATYYKVDIANFSDELAKTQKAFQQTVTGVTITDTNYNDDKTKATINGELMLKDQKDPAPLSYDLQKVDGQWKILG